MMAVAASETHSLAVGSGGAVWAWGFNRFGQLGDDTTDDNLAPVHVRGPTGVVSVAAALLD
ncbi:hypothetical protein [Cystobacter ferrugineus]|uniref:RCC1 repeat-containing protein n=1 Tax=Cystobacter ferrugineus TaxID=83449 RepID=A0A1L9B751_9BACT|nr:hypothetical protein [Cystobacter ferrugineus]OJH38078.1 hypothetical protein BON30_23220 [Cystobacter ferrugineus]